MAYDKLHWQNLQPPSAPDDGNVAVYKSLIVPGRVLLLGSTWKLLPLCDQALDIDPLYEDSRIQQGDWRDNKQFFDNIIGDGVFHLSQDLCNEVLEMCRQHCKVFVCRSFNQKLSTMKYACYFPTAEDFHIKPSKSVEFAQYTFYQWQF